MFLRYFYLFTKSEADVLINSVLRQNTACNHTVNDLVMMTETNRKIGCHSGPTVTLYHWNKRSAGARSLSPCLTDWRSWRKRQSMKLFSCFFFVNCSLKTPLNLSFVRKPKTNAIDAKNEDQFDFWSHVYKFNYRNGWQRRKRRGWQNSTTMRVMII